MISFLRRYRKPLFVAIIAVFLIGIFVGLGGYLFTSNDLTESVASVGSTKIPYSKYLVRVNQYLDVLRQQGGGEISDAMVKEVKSGMLREMIIEELLSRKADELGLLVTDGELARDIRGTPAFQRGGSFSEEAYFQAVRTLLHDTHQSYEESRRKTLKTNKLKQMCFFAAKLTPDEVRELYARENKGSLKEFEKNRAAFESRAQQQRALELLNFLLRQIGTQVEIRTYLDQREAGV